MESIRNFFLKDILEINNRLQEIENTQRLMEKEQGTLLDKIDL